MSDDLTPIAEQFNTLYKQQTMLVLFAVMDEDGRKRPIVLKLPEETDTGLMLFSSGDESEFTNQVQRLVNQDAIIPAEPLTITYRDLLKAAKERKCALVDVADSTHVNYQEIDSQYDTYAGKIAGDRALLLMNNIPVINEKIKPIYEALVQTLFYENPELGALWVTKIIRESDMEQQHLTLIGDNRFCDITLSEKLKKLIEASLFHFVTVTDIDCDELKKNIGDIAPLAIRNSNNEACVLNVNHHGMQPYVRAGIDYSPEEGDYFDYVEMKNIIAREKLKKQFLFGISVLFFIILLIAFI